MIQDGINTAMENNKPKQEVEKKPHEVCPKDSNGKCVAKIIDLSQPQPKEPKQESWVKSFREKFVVNILPGYSDRWAGGEPEELESFIQSLLTQEKERAYREGIADAHKPTAMGIEMAAEIMENSRKALAQAKELGRVEESARIKKLIEWRLDVDYPHGDFTREYRAVHEELTQLLGEMRGEE